MRQRMYLNWPRRSCACGKRLWTRKSKRLGRPLKAPRKLQVRQSNVLLDYIDPTASFPIKAPPPRKASAAISPSTPTAANSNSGARTAKNDGVSTSITGDKTRDKCIEILYDALALESGFRTLRSSAPLYPSRVAYLIHSIRSHLAAGSHRRRHGVQGL
jgi:hypothetical protein